MKRLMTILVVSALSVISINSSTFAASDTECNFCKQKAWPGLVSVAGSISNCDSGDFEDQMASFCEQFSSTEYSLCIDYRWSKDASDCNDYKNGAWSSADDYCSYKEMCESSSTSCPSDCVAGVTYSDTSSSGSYDSVRITRTFCGASTGYKCSTETETVEITNNAQFQDGNECAAGTCRDWDCKFTAAAGGTTCATQGAGGPVPFCTCVMETTQSGVTTLKTWAVRLWCNSTTSDDYNCNQGESDDSGKYLYCDQSYGGTSTSTGICRYKKTCSSTCENSWTAMSNGWYKYRLTSSCDYKTGSCVDGTTYQYSCNHDNKYYENGKTLTCSSPTSGYRNCTGCSKCSDGSTDFGNVSGNNAYKQQYKYVFSQISGSSNYQCQKVYQNVYQCNTGYYGNPGSSMSGCNACPTLAQSNLTVVKDENGVVRVSSPAGTTAVTGCVAYSGDNDSRGYLSDGAGTFYWRTDPDSGDGQCNYQ